MWTFLYPNIGIQTNLPAYGASASISILNQPLTPGVSGYTSQRVGVSGPPLPPPLGSAWFEVGWEQNSDGLPPFAYVSYLDPVTLTKIGKKLDTVVLGGFMHTYQVGLLSSTSWGAWIDGVLVFQWARGWGNTAPQYAWAGGEASPGTEPMGDANGDAVAYANCSVMLPGGVWELFPSPQIYNTSPASV